MTWISKKVEELISYDNTIAALCLRVANSPLFGRRTVETVSEAIVALRMKRVQSILLSCALTQVVPASHWANGCGHVLAALFGLCPGLPQDGHAHPLARHRKAYLAGLLHDLGILVNSLVCTEEYARVCSMPPVRACRSTKRKKKSWASPIAKPENSWPSSGTYPPISPR